jgi:hypothetical protein
LLTVQRQMSHTGRLCKGGRAAPRSRRRMPADESASGCCRAATNSKPKPYSSAAIRLPSRSLVSPGHRRTRRRKADVCLLVFESGCLQSRRSGPFRSGPWWRASLPGETARFGRKGCRSGKPQRGLERASFS